MSEDFPDLLLQGFAHLRVIIDDENRFVAVFLVQVFFVGRTRVRDQGLDRWRGQGRGDVGS